VVTMEECPICFDVCDVEKGFRASCCRKSFHKSCFEKCIQLNGKCPTCRSVYLVTFPEVVVRPIVRTNFSCIAFFIMCFGFFFIGAIIFVIVKG
jgi:hypothetical protein